LIVFIYCIEADDSVKVSWHCIYGLSTGWIDAWKKKPGKKEKQVFKKRKQGRGLGQLVVVSMLYAIQWAFNRYINRNKAKEDVIIISMSKEIS
jgi:hypothetical protein